MRKNYESNEYRIVGYIIADLYRKRLNIPKHIIEKVGQLASPEARLYMEYKNRYPNFEEVIY